MDIEQFDSLKKQLDCEYCEIEYINGKKEFVRFYAEVPEGIASVFVVDPETFETRSSALLLIAAKGVISIRKIDRK